MTIHHKMNKAYISSILSLIFLCTYVLGYYLNSYPNYTTLEIILYAGGLIWFTYVNWGLALFHLIIAAGLKFKSDQAYVSFLISGLMMLFTQAMIYLFSQSGIVLTS